MLNPAFVEMLESIDADGWADHLASAPPAVVEFFGLEVRRQGRGTLIMSRRDFLGLNRVLGLGAGSAIAPALLDEVLAQYARFGAKQAIAQLCPLLMDDALARYIAGRGIVAKGRHAKFWRYADAAASLPTELRLVEIGPPASGMYGKTAAEAYGDPPILAAGHAAAVGRRRWRHFMAFDADRPVATAALFLSGEVAWCGFAATLESDRGRGAHGALLAARVRAAAREGCRIVVCETHEATSQRPNPSFRNMQRAGFEVAYFRTNYLWTAPERITT